MIAFLQLGRRHRARTRAFAIVEPWVGDVEQTILKQGASGQNIYRSSGTVTSLGYNLSDDNGGGFLNSPGDQINANPMLGPLQDNGGPTFTHALLPGSPAIGAGNPSFTSPPDHDQRNCPFERVFNGRIDVGSFESQPQPQSRPCSSPRPPAHSAASTQSIAQRNVCVSQLSKNARK
jgi:hypothetical protein